MLNCILKTLKEMQKSNQKSNPKSNQKILLAIKENKQITIRELQEIIGLSESGVKKIIRRLRQNNLIKRIGGNKGGHWEVIDNPTEQ
jgi:ATP-dependent DNA helicase RecG